MAATVGLLFLVAGAAALVAGSGPPRDDRGDDEVAMPDRRDLQQADASTGTTAPRVHCVRDDVPVACVRWIRHPAAEGPDAPMAGGWPVRVASESVVTVEHNTVRTLSRGSGEVRWHHEFDGPVQTWHVIDDVVVLSASDGRTHALSIDDGAELWSADGVPPLTSPSREQTDAVHLFGNVGGGTPVLTAHAPQDGSVQWEYELPERAEDIGLHPEVAQAGSLTFLTMEAPRNLDLVALDREDGTERWQRRDSRLVHASDGVAVVVAIERIVEEEGNNLSISETPTALVGLDATDGTERWRQELPAAHRPMEFVDDVLVMTAEGSMTALDIGTGEERWRIRGQKGEHIVSTAPWWWGRGEPRHTDVLLSVVPRESLIVARDAGTGTPRWRTQLDRPVGDVTMVDGFVTVRTTEDSHVQLDLSSGAVLGTVTVEGPELPMFVASDVVVNHRSGWLVAVDLAPPQ